MIISLAHNMDEKLVELLKSVQVRAVQFGRSGFVRRHVKPDQRERFIKPCSLRKQMEIRWLSLYDSCERDFLLQRTLMRVYSRQDKMYKESDTKKRASLSKLVPKEEDYTLLSQFLGVLSLVQRTTLELQRRTSRWRRRISSSCALSGTVLRMTRAQLCKEVRGFCKLLEASLQLRFPLVPSDAVLLSAASDVRYGKMKRKGLSKSLNLGVL